MISCVPSVDPSSAMICCTGKLVCCAITLSMFWAINSAWLYASVSTDSRGSGAMLMLEGKGSAVLSQTSCRACCTMRWSYLRKCAGMASSSAMRAWAKSVSRCWAMLKAVAASSPKKGCQSGSGCGSSNRRSWPSRRAASWLSGHRCSSSSVRRFGPSRLCGDAG